MFKYIIKRLLLMVPTFLLITIVVFIVINIAPGRPTAGAGNGASGSEQADRSANAREGYRLFKEAYSLDKPIVLNFRFLLDRSDVQNALELIARNMTSALPGEDAALAVAGGAGEVVRALYNAPAAALGAQIADGATTDAQRTELERQLQNTATLPPLTIRPARPAQGDVYHAEEHIENWGRDVVPQLLELANGYVYIVPLEAASPWDDGLGVLESELDAPPSAVTTGQTVRYQGSEYRIHDVLTRKVRYLAVQRLSVNGARPLLVRPGQRASEELLARNAEIVQDNNRIRAYVYRLDASDEQIAATLANWNAWFGERSAEFDLTFGRRTHMLFLETRFARYWGNLAQLDLGTSLRYRRPVLTVIAEHWQYSIFLGLASLMLSYFISIPLGVLAAVKQNQFADRGIGIALFVLYSLPSFFVATMLATYLTPASTGMFDSWPRFVQSLHSSMQVFPISGARDVDPLDVTTWQLMKDIVWHMVLPVVALTYSSLAVLSRYARTGLLDVIRADYIRTARAKGLSESVVILKHAVRNGMIPILTLLGLTLPVVIGGSIIIEYIFAIDGMGVLMLNAITARDYNIIMGILLISSILTLIGILISDISYALVDPRISLE